MIDAVLSFLQQHAGAFLSWYIPMQIQTGIFVLIILAIDALLPNASPRFRYALWITALVKAMLPPVISLPVGDAIATQVIVAATATVSAPPVQQSPPPLITVESVAFLLVLSSSILYAILVVVRTVVLRWQIKDAAPFYNEVPSGFPPVWVSSRIHSPLATGLITPRIIITTELAEAPAGLLMSVLHHEAAHIRRRDALVVALQTIILIVSTLNPFVWMLNLRLFRYREQICDEAALQLTGSSPEQYGSLLLDFAAKRPSRMYQTGTCFFETRNGFAQRLTQLFRTPEMKSLSINQYLLVASICLLILPLSWRCGNELQQEVEPVVAENRTAIQPQVQGQVRENAASPLPTSGLERDRPRSNTQADLGNEVPRNTEQEPVERPDIAASTGEVTTSSNTGDTLRYYDLIKGIGTSIESHQSAMSYKIKQAVIGPNINTTVGQVDYDPVFGKVIRYTLTVDLPGSSKKPEK